MIVRSVSPIVLIAVLWVLLTPIASAQTKKPTAFNQRPPSSTLQSGANKANGSNQTTANGAVSRDLLELYESTQKLTKEEEFSILIERTQQVVNEPSRSSSDREYAKQLLAWGANKRGEAKCDRAGVLVSEGLIAQGAKLDQSATEDFLLALKHDPKRWKSKHNLGIVLAMQNKHDLAIAKFTEVIEENSKYPNAYFNRGEIYCNLREYDLAVADFSSAIQLNPNDAEAHSGRARAKFLNNDIESAIVDYRKAAQLDPSNIETLIDYADACQSVFSWTEAMLAYKKAIAIDKRNSRALQNSAWLMATCPEAKFRDPKSATEIVELAIEANGKLDYQLLDVQAAVAASSGDFTNAVKLAKRAKEQAPTEERSEIEQRLSLYQKNRAYLQPQSNGMRKNIATEDRSQTNRSASGPVGTGIR